MSEQTDQASTAVRERFTVGDRVRLTTKGWEQGLAPRHADGEVLGTVVGLGRKPDTITVRRDGRRTADSYHTSFWELTHHHAWQYPQVVYESDEDDEACGVVRYCECGARQIAYTGQWTLLPGDHDAHALIEAEGT